MNTCQGELNVLLGFLHRPSKSTRVLLMDFSLFVYCAISKYRVFQICLTDESPSKCDELYSRALFKSNRVCSVFIQC